MINHEARGKILIVEDEAVVLDMLERLLTRYGFQVRSALNGEAAFAYLLHETFEVILTDIMMPGGISGLDILAYAKEMSPHTTVLLYTAHRMSDVGLKRENMLADDYRLKPLRNDELRDWVLWGVHLAEERRTAMP